MTNISTIDGRLTADPELRFTPNGKAVAGFTIAHNTRRFNKDTNEWEDGDATFIDVTLWGKKGENLAHAATKGSVVLVTGALKQEKWEDKNGGGKRSKHVINAETVALVPAGQPQQQQTQGGGFSSNQGGFGAPAQSDPWSSAPPQGGFQDADAPF